MRPGIIIFLLCWFIPRVGVGDDTRLVPAQLRVGEVAQLIIEADFRVATLPSIDSAPLLADFRVLDISSRVTRQQQANGGIYHRAQWRIQITPKRVGRLAVPALAIGERKSKPLILEVEAENAVDSPRELFIEVDAQPQEPYVNQEIRIVTRIFHSSDFDWARLTIPRGLNVARYQHGGDRSYRIERYGREYQVLERSLSLFPRQGGDLLLDGAEYRARVGSGNNLDDRWLHRQAEALRLRVRERPAASGASHWIPARRVDVDITWAQPVQDLKVGEAAEFSLILVAEGLAAEFLPSNLLVGSGEGFQLFADREQRNDLLTDDVLVGRLEQGYAVVASRAGELVLPGLALDWWDTASDSARQTRLPPTSLTVVDPTAKPLPSPPPANVEPSRVKWVLGAGGGLAALLLLLVSSAGRRRAFRRWLAQWRLRRRLQRACQSDDAVAAQAALNAWCRTLSPGLMTDELRRARHDLDGALYAREPLAWRGDQLWQALDAAPRDTPRIARGARLPALYPEPDARF